MFDVVDPGTVGFSSARLNRVSQWLDEQVSGGRLPGASVLVARHGKIALQAATGMADIDNQRRFELDTVVRIYSMTKAITSVAAMMLHERGAFQLDDPIYLYLPEFKDTPVWRGGALDDVDTQDTPITVKHLLTHTSGLTYGFMQSNPVDAAYRDADIEFPGTAGSLEELVKRVAAVPLICQPGSQWNYSVSTDVLGRLVEVWSGRNLAQFFHEEILSRLGMSETGFHVDKARHGRFAALYTPKTGGDMSSVGKADVDPDARDRGGLKLSESSTASRFLEPTALYSGGGGLTSTLFDYAKFCQMLQNGGELAGERLLGRKTVEFMRMNHLPDNKDMAAMGQPVWSETSYDGIGFGLGFAVVIDPVKAHIVTSVGEHHWGGAASTFFWLDPVEEMFVVFLTQLMPSSTYPIRRELRARVYQALV